MNNFNQIQGLLDFSMDGTFYFAQILRRKKDQQPSDPQGGDNVIIKNYFIKSLQHFTNIENEIKTMCDAFNARAYIRLNRCLWEPVSFEVLSITAEYLNKKAFQNMNSVFATACGRRVYDPVKKWVIDVDNVGINQQDIIDIIEQSQSSFEKNVIAVIPTPNGYHLITHRFDPRNLLGKYSDDVSIQKNNPTVLYTSVK